MTISLIPAPKDRVPSMVLENGAVRWAVYDEAGQFLRYEYHLRADDPTEEGSRVNKMLLEAPGKVIFDNFYNRQMARQPQTISLSTSRAYCGRVNWNNKAYFVGGFASVSDATIDSFDGNLVRTTPASLSAAKFRFYCGTNDNYLIVAGGVAINNGTPLNTVDYFDKNHVRGTTTLNTGLYRGASASSNNYFFCMGGWDDRSRGHVNIFNKNMVRTSPTIIEARSNCPGGRVGNYALCFGGAGSVSTLSMVEGYDVTNLTKVTAPAMQTARQEMQAAYNNNYAICAENAYNANLVRTNVTMVGVVGNTAAYGGDANNLIAVFYSGSQLRYFNNSLVLSALVTATTGNINTANWEIYGGTYVGAYTLLMAATGVLDVIPSTGTALTIPPRYAYFFEGKQAAEIYTFNGATVNFPGSVYGYMRQAGIIVSGYDTSIT